MIVALAFHMVNSEIDSSRSRSDCEVSSSSLFPDVIGAPGIDDLPKAVVVDPAEFFEGFKVFLWLFERLREKRTINPRIEEKFDLERNSMVFPETLIIGHHE